MALDIGQWFSTKNDFVPPGTIGQCRDIFGSCNSGEVDKVVVGLLGEEKDAANHCTVHRTSSHNQDLSSPEYQEC